MESKKFAEKVECSLRIKDGMENAGCCCLTCLICDPFGAICEAKEAYHYLGREIKWCRDKLRKFDVVRTAQNLKIILDDYEKLKVEVAELKTKIQVDDKTIEINSTTTQLALELQEKNKKLKAELSKRLLADEGNPKQLKVWDKKEKEFKKKFVIDQDGDIYDVGFSIARQAYHLTKNKNLILMIKTGEKVKRLTVDEGAITDIVIDWIQQNRQVIPRIQVGKSCEFYVKKLTRAIAEVLRK